MKLLQPLPPIRRRIRGNNTTPKHAFDEHSRLRVRAARCRGDTRVTLIVQIKRFAAVDLVADAGASRRRVGIERQVSQVAARARRSRQVGEYFCIVGRYFRFGGRIAVVGVCLKSGFCVWFCDGTSARGGDLAGAGG